MARKVSKTVLNASTMDIINTIRENASQKYQDKVPKVEQETDIPKVGDVLYGNASLTNEFLTELMNRIALVSVKSATYNNQYARLKKGYLELGETVEEVFVNITKAREFSAEKAADREFKRTLPDVRTAFHAMNYRVQYPITIQREDIKRAFTSVDGVTDLVSRIIQAIYTAAEYDEFLIFKYLLIKAVTAGKMKPVAFDATDIHDAAVKFRATSNKLTFMSTEYNNSGVHTVTPRNQQIIFMDSTFNAQYDVDVLAAAFNMDKATYLGSVFLIDDFTTFDNGRFDIIRDGSDQMGEVTDEELKVMQGVKAILVDEEFFQVYDNLADMTSTKVAAGDYDNYFYNVWKTISYSPFSNAVVFVAGGDAFTEPETVTIKVDSKDVSDDATTLTFSEKVGGGVTVARSNISFVQTEEAVEAGVAIHRFGAAIIPKAAAGEYAMDIVVDGKTYSSVTKISADTEVGAELLYTKKG